MLVLDYVKALTDAKDDQEAEAILWGCTGWPAFWTGDPIRCLSRQLRHAKRSFRRGFTYDQIFEGKDYLRPRR